MSDVTIEVEVSGVTSWPLVSSDVTVEVRLVTSPWHSVWADVTGCAAKLNINNPVRRARCFG